MMAGKSHISDEDTAQAHISLASLSRVLPQEPGRIEYPFCLRGHLGGVFEI